MLTWEKLAHKAGLQDLNDRMLQKLIKQHPDQHLTTKALEQNWDLERFKASAAARELAKLSSASIRTANDTSEDSKRVFKVDFRSGPSRNPSKPHQAIQEECGRCGRKHCPSMEQRECPAKNAVCRFCGGIGHFISKCRKRQREMQSGGGKFNRPMANSTAQPQKPQWSQKPTAGQNKFHAAPAMNNDQIKKLQYQKDKYKKLAKLAKKGVKPSKSKRFVKEVKEAITEDSDSETDTSEEISSDSD